VLEVEVLVAVPEAGGAGPHQPVALRELRPVDLALPGCGGRGVDLLRLEEAPVVAAEADPVGVAGPVGQ
jgi:hypothetical protein